MKKTAILFLALLCSLALVGCDLFGTTTTTTTTVSTAPDLTIYPIGTAAELAAVDPWKSYVLTADIDLADGEWTPLGTGQTPYSGTFDGAGFTISHFSISMEHDGFLGLFGNVTGDIVDLNVQDALIDVSSTRMTYAGLIAGSTSGNLTGCLAQGAVSIQNNGGTTYAGLLAGQSASVVTPDITAATFSESVISDCSGYGTLEVASQLFVYVGGLIGKTFNVELNGCSAVADITTSSETGRIYAGGLVGHNYGGILTGFEAEIDRNPYILTFECLSRSKITVTSRGSQASVGGLYGYDNYGHVEKCAAFTEISATGNLLYVGGIAGENWSETVLNSVTHLLVSFVASEGQTLGLGGLAGYLEDDSTLQNSYYILESETVPTTAGGISVTVADIQTSGWYRINLTWNPLLDSQLLFWCATWLPRTAFVWE